MTNPHMRPSRLLRKLRAGQIAHSLKLNLTDGRAAEIAGQCGADAVWLDLEHVPNSIHHVEEQIRAAKIYDCDAIVRVERGSYSDLIRPFEMDATAIMVPHVMSAEDARDIAWRTRFHPIGRRPLDGGNADGAYCAIPVAEYIAQANRERMVIVQIEDPEAMEELEGISAVEGIDMIFFGPGDYSHAIGDPGNLNHPEVQAGYRRVAEVALKHGKFAGTVGPAAMLPDFVAMGYRFFNTGADVTALRQGFLSAVALAEGLTV